jgi:hypothetical protein
MAPRNNFSPFSLLWRGRQTALQCLIVEALLGAFPPPGARHYSDAEPTFSPGDVKIFH